MKSKSSNKETLSVWVEFFKHRARVFKFVKLVNIRTRPSCLSATKRRTREEEWEKFGCARKQDTMLPRMIAPSGKVGRTEAARVELCVCELNGKKRGRGGVAVIDSNDIFAPRATARV